MLFPESWPDQPDQVLTTRPVPESLSPAPVTRDHAARLPAPRATQLALDVAAFLGSRKAEDLAILDVSGPLAIVDYFVIATVHNTRQAQAIARELDFEIKRARGRRKRNQGGLESEDSNWVLLDYDDVVVHLQLPEARSYYGLESLWADAPRLPVPAPRAADAAHDEPRRPAATWFQIYPVDGSK